MPDEHGTAGTPAKPPVKAHVSTSSFYKDQVQVSVDEQVGRDKPYFVNTTISLKVGGGVNAGASKGETSGSANASVSGSVSMSFGTWMNEQEKNRYLQDVAGGRGGSRPEMTIIELIATGRMEAAANVLRRAKQMAAEKGGGEVGDTQVLDTEGEVSGGGGLSHSGGGTGAGATVQLSGGKGIRRSRTLIEGGKELYTVTITERRGTTLGGSVSFEAASGGYKDARTGTVEQSVSFLLTPGDAIYSECKAKILSAGTVAELNAIAERYPGAFHGRSRKTLNEKTGTTSAGVLGIGIDMDQQEIDEEGESTDPSGTTKTLRGGASLGGSFTVAGKRINPQSKTDSFSAEIGPGNKGKGVTQSEDRSVDVQKTVTNLADSLTASPTATVAGIVTGSKEVLKDRVDTTGVNLTDDSFSRIAETAKNPKDWLAAWNKKGVARGAAAEWEETRQKVLAAHGDRYLIAKAMKEWEKGDSGRSGDVERLTGETGVAFDIPDEIADQKPVYDQLMSPDLLSGAHELAAGGQASEAVKQLTAILARLSRLLATVQMHAPESKDPGKFSEMQRRLTGRAQEIRKEIARLTTSAKPAAPDAAAPSAIPQELPPVIGPPTKEQQEQQDQIAAARKEANDLIVEQVGVCQGNRVVEEKVFAEVVDELDDFYVDHAFIFNKLNSLKPVYQNWDLAIDQLKLAYPKTGRAAEQANRFAPNRSRWNDLNNQALK